MKEFANWSGVHRRRVEGWHQPSSEEEVATILDRARRSGQVVKVVGAGHSWSAAACTQGHAINLDRMDRVLEVDRARCRVRVEAGMRLQDLNARLAREGLAMRNLGSISEQSVAGAISTGTHGTGAGFGCLSTLVRGLTLMTAAGERLEITARDEELFAAARLGLGALGVVTEVELECEPAFQLAEEAVGLSFEEAADALLDKVERHEHVKLWWLPHTDRAMIYAWDRTDAPATAGPGLGGALRGLVERAVGGGEGVDLGRVADTWINANVFDGLLRLGARTPALIPRINQMISEVYFVDRRRVGRSDAVFNLAMPPVHRELEYGIPLEAAPEALRRLKALIDRRGLRVNFIVEVRFMAADDLWLSPGYGRASCQLGAYMAEAPDLLAYFTLAESLFLEYGGRPHWGKEFFASHPVLRQALPRLDDFAALRRRLDPHGRFNNAFLRRVFGA